MICASAIAKLFWTCAPCSATWAATRNFFRTMDSTQTPNANDDPTPGTRPTPERNAAANIRKGRNNVYLTIGRTRIRHKVTCGVFQSVAVGNISHSVVCHPKWLLNKTSSPKWNKIASQLSIPALMLTLYSVRRCKHNRSATVEHISQTPSIW